MRPDGAPSTAQCPNGWSLVRLGELCTILSGGTPAKSNPAFWKGDIPWVSGKDLKKPRLADVIDHISAEGLAAGSRLAPAGSVLILVRGMGLAKDLPVAVALRPMAFNQDVKALVPKGGLSGAYIRAAIYHSKEHLLSRIVPSAHGTMTLNLDDVENMLVPVPDRAEEAEGIARVLETLMHAADRAAEGLALAERMKPAAQVVLFSRGLRGDAVTQTEIGMLPQSWHRARLDEIAKVISSRMTYSELESITEYEGGSAEKVLGIKVSDMNSPGNEVRILTAALETLVSADVIRRRCAPPATIVFPKRGAAIATNKKRITTTWTVFDPNVIGVASGSSVDHEFLFHWFLKFDLRTITESGPTPQLNKKNLDPLIVPVPPTIKEQREIVTILGSIDRLIELHRQRRGVLDALFNSLLHKFMTGKVRVADLDVTAISPEMLSAVGK